MSRIEPVKQAVVDGEKWMIFTHVVSPCHSLIFVLFLTFTHTHTEESEYQTDYDEDAVLSDFDLSNPNSEHSEHTEDEEDETADTADTVR